MANMIRPLVAPNDDASGALFLMRIMFTLPEVSHRQYAAQGMLCREEYARERETRNPYQTQQTPDGDPQRRLRTRRDTLRPVVAQHDAPPRNEVEARQEEKDVREYGHAEVVHLGVVKPPQEVGHEEEL